MTMIKEIHISHLSETCPDKLGWLTSSDWILLRASSSSLWKIEPRFSPLLAERAGWFEVMVAILTSKDVSARSEKGSIWISQFNHKKSIAFNHAKSQRYAVLIAIWWFLLVGHLCVRGLLFQEWSKQENKQMLRLPPPIWMFIGRKFLGIWLSDISPLEWHKRINNFICGSCD